MRDEGANTYIYTHVDIPAIYLLRAEMRIPIGWLSSFFSPFFFYIITSSFLVERSSNTRLKLIKKKKKKKKVGHCATIQQQQHIIPTLSARFAWIFHEHEYLLMVFLLGWIAAGDGCTVWCFFFLYSSRLYYDRIHKDSQYLYYKTYW